MDGWCYLRGKLRTFPADRIRAVQPSSRKAKNVSNKALDDYFAGRPRRVAVLRFSENMSPWVATEHWHPEQKATWNKERLELKVPYSDLRELVQDVLRHGPDVEVIGPPELIKFVRNRLILALSRYQ